LFWSSSINRTFILEERFSVEKKNVEWNEIEIIRRGKSLKNRIYLLEKEQCY